MKYKECNVVCTMHKMHCSSACLLKLHIRDDKIVKITSAGDIPREKSWISDNSILDAGPIDELKCKYPQHSQVAGGFYREHYSKSGLKIEPNIIFKIK